MLGDDDVVRGEPDEAGQGAALLEDHDGVEAELLGDERGGADSAVTLEPGPHGVVPDLGEGDGGLVLVAYRVGSTVYTSAP